MLLNWVIGIVLCFPAAILAQGAVPAGTLIPVSLDHGINVDKVHSGQPIKATVMQDIPGTSIHRRAVMLGHVVSEERTSGLVRLELCFDTIKTHGRTVTVKTSLRALASFLEVEEAQVPEEMSSRGLTPDTWDTQQIGGDQVYRGGGPVTERGDVVGRPTAWGVLAEPRVQRGMPCRGAVGGNDRPQALWLFSSNACGVYGFAGIQIEHAGRSDPQGSIVLSSSSGKLDLGNGSALLLRVF